MGSYFVHVSILFYVLSKKLEFFYSLHVTYIQILLFFFICNFVIVAEKLLKQKTGKSFSHASLLLPSSIRTNSKKFSIEFKTSDAKTWPNKRVVYFLFRWKISKTTTICKMYKEYSGVSMEKNYTSSHRTGLSQMVIYYHIIIYFWFWCKVPEWLCNRKLEEISFYNNITRLA